MAAQEKFMSAPLSTDPVSVIATGVAEARAAMAEAATEITRLRARLLECENSLWNWSGGAAEYFERYGEPSNG
jgi:hypothetical protein